MSTLVPMTLTRGGESFPVVFQFKYSELIRQVGYSQPDSFQLQAWYGLPDHAQRVDSTPIGLIRNGKPEFQKVRHFQWTNTYVSAEGDRTYQFDRWVSAEHGLLKETMREGNTEISVLKRNGLP